MQLIAILPFSFIILATGFLVGYSCQNSKWKQIVDKMVNDKLIVEIKNFQKVKDIAASHNVTWINKPDDTSLVPAKWFFYGTIEDVMTSFENLFNDDLNFQGKINLRYLIALDYKKDPVFKTFKEFIFNESGRNKTRELFLYYLSIINFKKDFMGRWTLNQCIIGGHSYGEFGRVWEIHIDGFTRENRDEPSLCFREVPVLKEVVDATPEEIVAFLQSDDELKKSVLSKLSVH